MDYIPVYEGEDSDDGSVKLSPGKIQRTGVEIRAGCAARRSARSIRAPGTIQLDERRVSVIAMRVEGFVQKVAERHDRRARHKGQPLMGIYSPAISSAAAEYISTHQLQDHGGDGRYGTGSRQRLMNLDVPEAAIAAIEKSRERSARDRMDRAARRHRSGTQRRRGHARAARRRAVPDRRSLAWSGRWSMSPNAISAAVAIGQQVAVARARVFPARTFTGKISADLSAYQHGDAHGAGARSNCPIPMSCC